MPFGSDVVVMEGGVGAAAIVIRSERVALKLLLSVTRAVKSKSPAVVGVPEILPLTFKVRPGARFPEDTANE